MEKGSKPNKEHDAQIAAQARKDAEKEFKQIAEKVTIEIILVFICVFWVRKLKIY